MKPFLVVGSSADRFSGGATFSMRGNPRPGVGTAAAYQYRHHTASKLPTPELDVVVA
jgi:hypothetical protein